MKWLVLLGCAVALISNACGADSGKAADVKVEEPTPESIIAALDGHVEARPGGGWIQAKMDGLVLALAFYDEKAKLMKPVVDRAFALFIYPGRARERRVLVPMGGDDLLRHPKPLRPPHVFKVLLSLFKGESEEAVENYSIDFN